MMIAKVNVETKYTELFEWISNACSEPLYLNKNSGLTSELSVSKALSEFQKLMVYESEEEISSFFKSLKSAIGQNVRSLNESVDDPDEDIAKMGWPQITD